MPCTVVTPGPVTGQANVCPYIGAAQQLSYSVESLPDATSYEWTVPPTVTLVSGQGTTAVAVTINNGFLANANKLIKVRAVFPCGTSANRLFYLKAQFPGTPKPIAAGSTNVCAFVGTGNAVFYSIPSVSGAETHVWLAPAFTTVSHPNGSGLNDTAILVTFLNGFSGGSISVQSVNTCGASSLRSLAIQTNIPSRPGLINGSTNVCENVAPDGTARTFSVAPVAGATAYTWTAPAGSVVTHPNGSGANDFIITVLFPSGFGNGIITVAAGNGCATSATRSLSVNTLQPAAPGVITSTIIAECPNRVYTYSLPAIPANSHSVQWTIPLGGVILNGQGTASVTVSYTSTAVSGSVTAAGVSTCGSSGIRAASVELADCDAPPPPPPPPFARNFTDNLQQPEDKMMLKISPNPSVNDFKLQVVSPDKEIINIRILDLSGIELRKMIVAPNGIVRFGSELKAGTYILQAKQGNHKMTGKLIRLKEPVPIYK